MGIFVVLLTRGNNILFHGLESDEVLLTEMRIGALNLLSVEPQFYQHWVGVAAGGGHLPEGSTTSIAITTV